MSLRNALGRTSRAIFLPCLCLLPACTQPPAPDSSPTPESLPLQGTWKEGDVSVTIEGNSLYFYERPDFQYDTLFTLVSTTEPKQLRATILDSPRTTDSEGDVVFAIYSVEGDVLRLAAIGEDDWENASFDDVESQCRLVKSSPGE